MIKLIEYCPELDYYKEKIIQLELNWQFLDKVKVSSINTSYRIPNFNAISIYIIPGGDIRTFKSYDIEIYPIVSSKRHQNFVFSWSFEGLGVAYLEQDLKRTIGEIEKYGIEALINRAILKC